MESSQCIRADYLAGQTEILPKMRAVLIDWLVQHTALHCTALHCTALHCTALHCTALHCGLHCRHCTALHCTALHCTALHCTAPHRTALHRRRTAAHCDHDTSQVGVHLQFHLLQETLYTTVAILDRSFTI